MTTIPKAGIVCEKSFLIIDFSFVCVCVRECEIVGECEFCECECVCMRAKRLTSKYWEI